MKFSLLAVGSRFEYQGEIYTKVSPLIASLDSTGGQRMIARAANVNPVGEGMVAEAQVSSDVRLNEAGVTEAVQAYHEQCLAVFDQVAESLIPVEAQTMRKELEQALKACKQALAMARVDA